MCALEVMCAQVGAKLIIGLMSKLLIFRVYIDVKVCDYAQVQNAQVQNNLFSHNFVQLALKKGDFI